MQRTTTHDPATVILRRETAAVSSLEGGRIRRPAWFEGACARHLTMTGEDRRRGNERALRRMRARRGWLSRIRAAGGQGSYCLTATPPTTVVPITELQRAPRVEHNVPAGREGIRMDDGARETGSLEPLRARGPRRSPWGRRPTRTPDGAGMAARPAAPAYAALDLGTNNCRLLIARPTPDGFRVVDAFSRIVRLGEGVSTTGRLAEAAIERAMGALAVCRDKIAARGTARMRLIATEACRAAANGPDFVARVERELGLCLDIIDRETEARLAATGCTPLIDPALNRAILFDIGGGSSEIVNMGGEAEGAGPPRPAIREWISLPLGVVTLAEKHGGVHVDRPLFETMVDEVRAHLGTFAAEYACGSGARFHMLGTSGTVTTIAGVHLGLKRYDRRQVDGCWMSDGEIGAVVETLLGMSYAERVANGCIGAERADLVLAGCAILEAIRRAFPCSRLRVADRGLREGMLVEMMREDRVWAGGR